MSAKGSAFLELQAANVKAARRIADVLENPPAAGQTETIEVDVAERFFKLSYRNAVQSCFHDHWIFPSIILKQKISNGEMGQRIEVHLSFINYLQDIENVYKFIDKMNSLYDIFRDKKEEEFKEKVCREFPNYATVILPYFGIDNRAQEAGAASD